MFHLTHKSKTLLISFFFLFSTQALASFSPLSSFGDNPGEIDASYYANKAQSKNLVVLLHGCVQSGETLAQQSGLLALAKAHNFALLVPQQKQSNNIKNCFNWFSEQDTNKNSGETLSLMNMITTFKKQQNSEQVFIIGLSAGGAMASSLLVHYPEAFKAGAIVAGIPYPCANNLIKAISCMRGGPSQSPEELTQAVKAINKTNNYWPKLSVWTGSKDQVVSPKNAQHLAKHWAELSSIPSDAETITKESYQIQQWKNQQNNVQVELIEINNLGHGIAINSKQENGGSASDFVLESPLSSAIHIIDFWQINKENTKK